MPSEDRHINFKLMRERVLALQDRSVPPAVAGGSSLLRDEVGNGVDYPPASTTPTRLPRWGPRSAGGTDKLVVGGKNYWRSLEELADSPQFREFVQREYPQQ